MSPKRLSGINIRSVGDYRVDAVRTYRKGFVMGYYGYGGVGIGTILFVLLIVLLLRGV